MKILDLVQGSDEWKKKRLECLCASEAPMMMGCSPYMSRNQLLDLKKGWQKNPTNSFTQKIFDDGHEFEAQAREILELHECADFPAVVGFRLVQKLPLLASFDGLEDGEPGALIFEHKQWNETLAENVRNGILEPYHYWQLEHQCLVSESDEVRFVCSDGTENKWVTMTYVSDPDLRKELIKGWKQFMKDLATHEIAAKKETVVAIEAEAFPIAIYNINGSAITSNLSEILPIFKARAEAEMNRSLETDQDFANKELFNKSVKAARAQLKERVDAALGEFVSLREYKDVAGQLDSVMQQMQSHGERQVKEEKDKKKNDIESAAQKQISAYASECDGKICPLSIAKISQRHMPDFFSAMKGKRTLESLKAAVDTVIAQEKIEIDSIMARIVPNQIYLKSNAKDYAFLFNDVAQIINQETEPFQAVVDKRIADHKKADELRLKGIQEEAERVATLKAENMVKGKELIASWEAARSFCQKSDDLNEVAIKWDFIQHSNCDEKIFPDNFMEALDIYDQCFGDISDKYKALYKPPVVIGADLASGPDRTVVSARDELGSFEQVVIDDPVSEEVQFSAQTHEESAPLTFVEEIENWAKVFDVSRAAVHSLTAILKKHRV